MSRRSSRPAAFIAALFLTFTLAIAPNASQAQERQPVARVVAQVGPVTALSGSEPRSLHLSAPLFEGEHVVTGPNAKVQLELADGSRLSLGAGTRVAIDRVSYGADGQGLRGVFNLILGILRASLSGPVWRDGFSIETRAAVASVRSTDFVTEAAADKTSVFVVEGRVAVATDTVPAVVLGAGLGVDVPLGAGRIEAKTWGQGRVDGVLARTRVP